MLAVDEASLWTACTQRLVCAFPPAPPVQLVCPAYNWCSGGSHGFVIGHVCPEAQEGGPIALLRDGDTIRIDAKQRVMDVVGVSAEEMEARRKQWVAPPLKATQGTLYKYIKAVGPASHGCVTDA